MKILAVSDVKLAVLSTCAIRERFQNISLIVSCGDLPFDYLELIADCLYAPVYYVFGNHQPYLESNEGIRFKLDGGIDLGDRCVRDSSGLILAGLDGCLRYDYGRHQYSQAEMWQKVINLIPQFYVNKIRYGRYLDVLVTHAPPWGINDRSDLPHQGFKAFRWLIKTFQPMLHLHGHVHLYRQNEEFQTRYLRTCVMNTYGYREIEIHLPKNRPGKGQGSFELLQKRF